MKVTWLATMVTWLATMVTNKVTWMVPATKNSHKMLRMGLLAMKMMVELLLRIRLLQALVALKLLWLPSVPRLLLLLPLPVYSLFAERSDVMNNRLMMPFCSKLQVLRFKIWICATFPLYSMYAHCDIDRDFS